MTLTFTTVQTDFGPVDVPDELPTDVKEATAKLTLAWEREKAAYHVFNSAKSQKARDEAHRAWHLLNHETERLRKARGLVALKYNLQPMQISEFYRRLRSQIVEAGN